MPAEPDVAGRLRALRAAGPDPDGSTCLAVRDLVVVCASSRGGSSLFGEFLRRSPQLLTFSAEINPHVTIPTLGSGDGCDVVANPARYATGQGLDVLRGELANDLGRPADVVAPPEFTRQVAWRLTMQWPGEPIHPAAVAEWVADVLAVTPRPNGQFDRVTFTLDLLQRVRRHHPAVDPYRYDIPDQVVAARFPEVPVPLGPTAEPVVEMAPFVLPRPWAVASPSEAAARTVVATTPRNAFRLPLLLRAFPNATVRVVHLVRNPAAAVNGLRDGWLHRGFFSCRSEAQLAIDGYSDRHPAWGRSWWNYDVPPGWRAWADRPLTEVCSYQWHAAHESTMTAATEHGLDIHRVAVEDVVGDPATRDSTVRRMAAWLGIDPAPLLADERLPVVMPTAPPRPRRWADNAAALTFALQDTGMLAMAQELGYPRDPHRWR